jgi:hypothetical protein
MATPSRLSAPRFQTPREATLAAVTGSDANESDRPEVDIRHHRGHIRLAAIEAGSLVVTHLEAEMSAANGAGIETNAWLRAGRLTFVCALDQIFEGVRNFA